MGIFLAKIQTQCLISKQKLFNISQHSYGGTGEQMLDRSKKRSNLCNISKLSNGGNGGTNAWWEFFWQRFKLNVWSANKSYSILANILMEERGNKCLIGAKNLQTFKLNVWSANKVSSANKTYAILANIQMERNGGNKCLIGKELAKWWLANIQTHEQMPH